MKKHKMLITLAGLVVALATTATVAAYTLAGDGSSPPANESVGTQEPAFQDDKLPIFDPLFYTIYSTEDDKGSVSVTNPNLHGDPEPTHGDPEPTHGDPKVQGNAPAIQPLQGHGIAVGEPSPEYDHLLELAKVDLANRLGLADADPIRLATIGKVEWENSSLGNPQPGMTYDQAIVPGFAMLLEADGAFYMYHTSLEEAVFVEARNTPVLDVEPGEVVPVLAPEEDVEVLDDQLVRVGPGTGELIDPIVDVADDQSGESVPVLTPEEVSRGTGGLDALLATGAQVEVTGEVVSEGIFSVDGTIILVNGERVQVMDFGDAAALEAQAAGISPTGSSIATNGQASMVLWVAPPHFFRTHTAIVLYVGENSDVIDALTSVLGPQFAGR